MPDPRAPFFPDFSIWNFHFYVQQSNPILYFLLYFQNNKISENDAVKNIAVKYKLGTQEEKV